MKWNLSHTNERILQNIQIRLKWKHIEDWDQANSQSHFLHVVRWVEEKKKITGASKKGGQFPVIVATMQT